MGYGILRIPIVPAVHLIMTLTEAIETRKSIRTYDRHKPLTDIQLSVITEAISQANGESGGLFRCAWATTDGDSVFRPATYGTIRDAAGFIPVAFDISSPQAALTVGRIIERLVLQLTSAGIGTCWLGGTFKAASFSSVIKTDDTNKVNIVIACGNAAEKLRLRDRLTRSLFRCTSRKPFDELFTDPNGDPISADSCWRPMLAAMRLAPSAMNAQPWRVVVDNDKAHVFGIIRNGLNYVDMGIGMEHIAISAAENGITICDISDKAYASLRKNLTYICSISHKNCSDCAK